LVAASRISPRRSCMYSALTFGAITLPYDSLETN
jgi:hypothetical protein